jgi:hypothetical protein
MNHTVECQPKEISPVVGVRKESTDTRSTNQRVLAGVCESAVAQSAVMLLVVLAVGAVFMDYENAQFELFCTIFFVIEVSWNQLAYNQ